MKIKDNRKSPLPLLLALAVAVVGQTGQATAQTIGMVADAGTGEVTVFDADAKTVLGSVTVGSAFPASLVGDCSITSDQTLGFVTNFNSEVKVIDLTTSTPSLHATIPASSPGTIQISNFGEDTSITPDGKFLVTCDGGLATDPVSVVAIATGTEVSTFPLGTDCMSVDVCSDGSVLVTSNSDGTVRRLTIGSTGNLTDTGESLFSGGTGFSDGPNDVFCAPDAKSGIVVRRMTQDTDPVEIKSFTIPFGPAAVDIEILTGAGPGTSGLINPAGNRVFARTAGKPFPPFIPPVPGSIDAFTYDSNTALLTPDFTINPVAVTINPFGIDQMALHPDGTIIYVPEPGKVSAFDASTGASLSANDITLAGLVVPTGICFATPAQKQKTVDIKPGDDGCINNNGHGVIPVAILGRTGFDVRDIVPSTVMLEDLKVKVKRNGQPQVSYKDVNNDGLEDLVALIEDEAGVLDPSATTAKVTALLFDGTLFEGTDSICVN